MSHLFLWLWLYLLCCLCRTMSLWTSSITSRATWRQGCRITHRKVHPFPAKMAWQAHAAPVEARSTTPLYQTPAPQHTYSLWRTHTNKGCRNSAPFISSPSAPGEIRMKTTTTPSDSIVHLMCVPVASLWVISSLFYFCFYSFFMCLL